MNSSGWLRSMMAANMEMEEFLLRVADIIGREFEKDVLVMEIMKGEYMIGFGDYRIFISRDMVEQLKGPIGPYRLDKYILNDFIIQGFRFDKRRSQYIRNVYGVFE